MKNTIIKILAEFSRFLLGATFLFSGFVKSVDPHGTAYKIEDYLAAFDLTSLSFLSMPASFFLCGLEFIMGAALLLGIYRKWTSRLIFLTMCFMTPLTLYLAIADPVDDCGCFGDFLVISNWETFYKNIVLLLCAVVVLKYHERLSNLFTGKTYWLAFLYLIAFTLLFLIRSYFFEPIFDFRPYKIGANLPELMKVEDGKGRVEENIMVYEKDGVEKVFTEDNYPWEDEAWKFVRLETKVIQEGEKAVINDFSITELSFNSELTELEGSDDITERVLSDSNYVFLMVTPSLQTMSTSYLSNFEDVAYYTLDNHYDFYCLTASVTDEIMAWERDQISNFKFAHVDERVLKTMMRSNPGLMLLKNGVIINKWSDFFVPGEEDLNKPLDDLDYGHTIDQASKDKRHLIYIILIFVVPLLLLKGIDFGFFRRRKIVEETKSECPDSSTEEL